MNQDELNYKKRETLKRLNQESNQMTRECICTALLSLMATETFDQITVTAIIKRAGVSRGGFYRNYASKEDVLREIGEGLFQFLLDFISDSKFYEDTRAWCIDFFQSIADHADAYKLLIKAQAPKDFVFQFDEERLLRELQRDESPLERYRALAIGKSLAEISITWFQNGMKESPEEMAEIILKIFFINN